MGRRNKHTEKHDRRAEGIREVAESYGCSYDVFWRMAKNGYLRTIRIGNRLLVPIDEIERISKEGLPLKRAVNE